VAFFIFYKASPQMDTVNQDTSQLMVRFQRRVVLAWEILCRPTLTAILLAVLAMVILLRFLIPQQANADVSAVAWVSALPAWIQPWGEALFFLGLARIFQSIWFWLPVALLALNSLVALANYAWPSWRRAREESPDLAWQHPLTYRVEQSARLPAGPDLFLDDLKARLAAKGFSIHEPEAEKERVIVASRGQWAWWGVFAFYGGLVLLCLAFLVSHYSLGLEWLTLVPLKPEKSRLFGSSFELLESEAEVGLATVNYYRAAGADGPQRLTWRRSRPTLVGSTIILVTAIEPLISVEARDGTGELRRLMPVQVELEPDIRLDFPLGEADAPFYFLIPSASLAFQISPVSILTDQTYNVQVLRRSEKSPSKNLMMALGETFEVDDLAIRVFLDHHIRLIAYRDGALPLYGLSLAAIVAGGLLLLLQPPWLVWLMPEVKGRGGQLYGVVEKFGFEPPGRTKTGPEFLAQLLAPDSSPGEESRQESTGNEGK
jgi:hypothetical protein